MAEVLDENDLDKRESRKDQLQIKDDEEYEVRLIIFKVINAMMPDGSAFNRL
jgi:hypothetical protein